MGEFKNSSPEDVLTAMAVGYEAAGRFGDMIRGGRPGLHASFVVAFGGTVAAARLLGLTVEQMAHALGITATTMGGILIGTDSWAREYMAGNARVDGGAVGAGGAEGVHGESRSPRSQRRASRHFRQ